MESQHVSHWLIECEYRNIWIIGSSEEDNLYLAEEKKRIAFGLRRNLGEEQDERSSNVIRDLERLLKQIMTNPVNVVATAILLPFSTASARIQ